MQVVLEHLKENYRWYVVGLVCVLPPLIVFRKRVVPVIAYVVELLIYMAIVHVVVHFVAELASWFKDQSTMKRARGLLDADYNPGWDTPLLRFWDTSVYDPRWLMYFEIGLCVVILVLMWKYRPLRVRPPKPKAAAKKKPAPFDYRKTK